MTEEKQVIDVEFENKKITLETVKERIDIDGYCLFHPASIGLEERWIIIKHEAYNTFWDNWYANFENKREAIQRVRELHKPYELYGVIRCSICTWGRDENPEEYPCPTIEALDGEQ